MRPDSLAEAQPAYFGGALLRGRASVGSDGWLKTLGMCRLSGRLIAEGVMRPVGTEERAFWHGRWRNGCKRPVLKHGPRSLTSTRVFGCQTRPRSESERRWEPLQGGAPSTDPEVFGWI